MSVFTDKTIAVLGIGNMGSSILEGLLAQKAISAASVIVYDKIEDRARRFAESSGARLALSAKEAAGAADILILAMKPQDFSQAAALIRGVFRPERILISILAGTPMAKIEKALAGKWRLVRAMPNLGAQAGASVTALASTDEAALKLAEAIFSGCGKTVRVEEKFFDVVTALSGSGPAYFFFLMEELAAMGVRLGLSREAAQALAVQTAVGAGQVAARSKDSPGELRRKVTSKGGTTEAAFKVFDARGFSAIFQEALESAVNRSRELSQM